MIQFPRLWPASPSDPGGKARVFDALLDLSPGLVYVLDTSARYVHVSHTGARIVGFTPEQMIGKTWRELGLPSIVEQFERRLRDVFATGRVVTEHITLPETAGFPTRHFDYTITPVPDDAGALDLAVVVARDVTDRYYAEVTQERLRAREEHLRLAVVASDLGTWEVDYGNGLTQWSPRCREMFGFDASEEITYPKILERVHPEDRERMRQAGADSGNGDLDLEYRIVRKTDGAVRWIRSKGRSFVDTAGVRRRIGVTMDVTTSKVAAEALGAAKEQAERANSAKDQFLAVLSHELRTPLTPVLALAGAMESDVSLPAAVRDDARTIRRGAELEARLIDDLLDLTRISKGKISLERQAVDVGESLEEVVRLLNPEAAAKRLSLTFDNAAGGHPCAVHGDPARLQQVFWNLVKNAIKFTPEGGAITARLACADPGNSLRVEVVDSGVGIDPLVLPRIFDAFEQGDTDITRLFGGLGLGLAITKSLVELHHGTICAASPGRNQGATFTVTLPVVAAVCASASSSPAEPLVSSGAPSAPTRLLLVEDHEESRRVLTRLLESRGYSVLSAGTVREALDIASRHAVDLVVSDLGLPDGSGHELMSTLAAAHRLRGIALSGYGMEEDIRRSREAGFLEHLTKPVDLGRLDEVIRRAVAVGGAGS